MSILYSFLCNLSRGWVGRFALSVKSIGDFLCIIGIDYYVNYGNIFSQYCYNNIYGDVFMKRTLSLFLTLVMALNIITIVPVTVSAASVDDLTFELNEDGKSYSVTDCDAEAEGELVIPETYNGLSVTSIGDWAFYECKKLTSVTIPDGITSINSYTFQYCTNLKSVTIGNSIASIGDGAFTGCTSLTAFDVSNNNAYYESSNGVLFTKHKVHLIRYPAGKTATVYTIPDSVTSIGGSAFSGCTSLTSITIPDSVTSIGNNAFYNTGYYNDNSNWKNNVLYIDNHLIEAKKDLLGEYQIKSGTKTIADAAFQYCDALTSVTIPDGVVCIGSYAFDGCEKLEMINIPNSVTNIGEDAFHWCDSLTSFTIPSGITSIDRTFFIDLANLTEINVDENNDSFSSIDGVLFNKDETILLAYPVGKSDVSYNIPDGVTIIGDLAFCRCKKIENVILPDSTISIGIESFEYCSKLESISLGKNISSVGGAAFYGCSRLKDVYYNGTSEEQKNISIESFNTSLISATWHYKLCEHIPSSWITDQEATVYKAGSKHKECTECGEVLETAEIPQLKCSKPNIKSASNSGKDVKISWSSVSGADYYYVYRKVSGGSYSYIGKTTKTSFADDSAKAGKTYTYKVRAKNEASYSEYSSTKTVKHLDQPSLKTAENTTSGVKISWSKVSGASGYKVYRKTSDGWKYLGKTSKTYFTDKTAKSGQKYTYTVKAYSGDYNSSYNSTGVSKYYLADPTLKTPSSTKSGVSLKWSKVTGAQGYIIYRKTSSGSYKKLKTEKGVSNLSYVDKSAKKGKKYTYKVKAYYSKTYSAYSNTKKIKDKY